MNTITLLQAGGTGAFLVQILPIAAIFLVFYFIVIAPANKQRLCHRRWTMARSAMKPRTPSRALPPQSRRSRNTRTRGPSPLVGEGFAS